MSCVATKICNDSTAKRPGGWDSDARRRPGHVQDLNCTTFSYFPLHQSSFNKQPWLQHVKIDPKDFVVEYIA